MSEERKLQDDVLDSISGGVVKSGSDTIPVEALLVFIRTCKNSWGLDLEGAIENFTANWGTYSSQWKKSGINPDYDACLTFIKSHWNNVF